MTVAFRKQLLKFYHLVQGADTFSLAKIMIKCLKCRIFLYMHMILSHP